MKHKSGIILLIIILLTIPSVSSTTVFLTSDNVGDSNNDLSMLNSIKDYIEEISNGEIEVIIDSMAPSPGEGTRAIESNADVSVNLAAVDAANLNLLVNKTYSSQKQVIFVNMGNLDLTSNTFVRRAWDDNYSSMNFAGIHDPGKFLNDAQITYIQPLQEYSDAGSDGVLTRSTDEINQYIAREIVNSINNYDSSNKTYDVSLIETHTLSPSVMAKASSEVMDSDLSMNDTYNSYTAPQVLYMAASYLNGTGLEEPASYNPPSNPDKHSTFAKSSYTYYDYIAIGTKVKEFMDVNGKAPDYIEYDGARIGYYDLVYNFAKITENHTSSSDMDFAREYNFVKVNGDSLITKLTPFIGIGALLVVAYFIIRWRARRRYYRKRRR
ncbi:adhesin [Methanosphaera sp. WGK6]|uniref:adhesin n=1 Tax=Methanosphaera sp. WGK6 TaxID=1561964 RepID=UPI00084C76E3|nr:adhesin [Methanosphaera sp. WGK6]OED29913.1 adhesin [Methanosphaera sp. WGK6]